MTTLANLVTQARDEVNEPTEGFWKDAEIKRWLNRANRELTRAYRLEATTPQTIDTVDGTESYALASDFGMPIKVEIVDDTDDWRPLRRAQPWERIDGKDEPGAYYITEGRLYLIPKPDAAYEIRVWYFRSAPQLSLDADKPVIPEDYHDLLVDYAVARAKQKDDDPAYTTYDARFEDGKTEMVRQRAERDEGADQPTVVRYVDDDWLVDSGPTDDD